MQHVNGTVSRHGLSRLLASAGIIFLLSLTLPVAGLACHKNNQPHGPKGGPCEEPPPPGGETQPDVDVWWLPSGESSAFPTTAAAEVERRPCSNESFGINGGQYHCQHQDTRPPITFDFTGVDATQTKKNGYDGMCAAMNDITIVANSAYQLHWEIGKCNEGGCTVDVYTGQWFNGPDVPGAVAAKVGPDAPPIRFIRVKPFSTVTLTPEEAVNPFALLNVHVMDTATVRFIKAGTNRDAAVCVYDWTKSPVSTPPLVLESVPVVP